MLPETHFRDSLKTVAAVILKDKFSSFVLDDTSVFASCFFVHITTKLAYTLDIDIFIIQIIKPEEDQKIFE